MVKSTTGSGNAPAAKGTTTTLGRTAAPLAVRRAVQLMLAGAAGTFVWGIYWAVVTLAFRSDTVTYYVKTAHLSASKASAEIGGSVLLIVVQAVLYAAFWVLMARMNRDGHGWARIVSIGLFLLWTYYTYQSIVELKTYIGLGNMIIELLIWGAGSAVLVNLWRPESTAYFKHLTPEAPKTPPVTRNRRLPAGARENVTVRQPGETSRKPGSSSRRLTYEARRKRGAGPHRDLTCSP
jgi:hypothetical protein